MFRNKFAAKRFFCMVTILSLVVGRGNMIGKIKVSCIGDSITYGMTLEDRLKDSYPSRLQALLGDGYEVGNFGKSGTTLLRNGHRPYVEQEEMRAALDFAGDIVVIHLGINDTDPRDWPLFQDEFIGDYLALIDTLRSVNPAARFYVCRMTPIGSGHPRFISGTKVWHTRIQEAIERVAKVSGATLIDLYEPLHHYQWLLPDNVHPAPEGAMMIATKVYQSITGDFGGLSMAPLYSDCMVLPHGKEFAIHGIADPGEVVVASACGRQFSGWAGSDGKWSIVMGPFPASSGNSMTVRTRNHVLTFRDVAFGEIWLCSGQSNMEFEQGNCSTATDNHNSADSGLRLFDIKCRWRTDDAQWPATALDSVAHLQYMRPAVWKEATPETVRRFSAVGYYFGRALRDSLDVPVGLICNAVGGSTAESWISREILENEFPAILDNWLDNDLIMSWARGRAKRNLSASNAYKRHPYEPCYLHEAAIIPLMGYPVSGVIWYQGESNEDRIEVHEKLFPLLVDSFREVFGPVGFHYVQLSSLGRRTWPMMRDSQRRLLGCRDNLTMTVTSDLGDPLDVHYKNKRPVGERLALAALANDYGRKELEYSGPLADKAFLETPSSLRITFTHSSGLGSSDGGDRIRGFEVMDEDTGLFAKVAARVVGDAVLADVSAISRPSVVRYAWEPFTRADLVNGSGLPASTFRMEIENAGGVPAPVALLPLPQRTFFKGSWVEFSEPVFEVVDSIPGVRINQDEAYSLVINETGAHVRIISSRGRMNAIHTLEQLRRKDLVPECEITDWPAFRVRGWMMDVGRTYVPVDELRREIEIMSRFKLNTFHWHLTDNQGYRLESRRYPSLNARKNMTRLKGKFYTWDDVRMIQALCEEKGITLIPEFDMPGHSAYFDRAFGFPMQSPGGKAVVSDLLDEWCDLFDGEWIHIGTDEVGFTDNDFIPEIVRQLRGRGKKVMAWNPGWKFSPGEIDMAQLWSYRGKAVPGIPAVDCRLHYINHFDTYGDIVGLHTSRIYGYDEGSEDIAGSIVALWNDRYIDDETKMIRQNNLYEAVLALADRAWRGGGYQYFDDFGVILPEDGPAWEDFIDFERRLLSFGGEVPLVYKAQTCQEWQVSEIFGNGGDLAAAFPPETGGYDWSSARRVPGAGIYFRHTWGDLVPALIADPRPNSTAYARTTVYSDRDTEALLFFETQNYSRSERDLPPPKGEWDFRKSRLWLNGKAVTPPVWSKDKGNRDPEAPFGNENSSVRPPIKVRLKKGDNEILVRLPVGEFSTGETRLVKWMFTCQVVGP